MQISLFVPCFIDQFFPDAALSIVKILEKLGHEVHYPEGQTCCGQPPFNSGYWQEAKGAALHTIRQFRDSEFIVSPSGSCGAMLRVFYPELFAGTKYEAEARQLAPRVWEFSTFLVHKLGVTDLGASFPCRATIHDGGHGLRELGIKQAPRTLLKHVRGLQLIEMSEAETCCGFGGTFAVKFPHISTAMGEVKCASILETSADCVISNDASCLMQIQGILHRIGKLIPCLHIAQVLSKF
ncbi:MAG: (Fe-S)-binding protein [Chthoniobacterales bacterium]|nr:(Fe-S)-binding protein [Chthoniobacterales bacterium]